MLRYTVGWNRSPPLYGSRALDISTRNHGFTRTTPSSSTQEPGRSAPAPARGTLEMFASRYSGRRSGIGSIGADASRKACRNSARARS